MSMSNESEQRECKHRWLVGVYNADEVHTLAKDGLHSLAIPVEVHAFKSCKDTDEWMQKFIESQRDFIIPQLMVEITRTKVSHFKNWIERESH